MTAIAVVGIVGIVGIVAIVFGRTFVLNWNDDGQLEASITDRNEGG